MNPLFIAVIICWILSVGIHEFSHALAAYLGGDRSEQTRQYLKFNIFNYVHPVTTFLMPAIILAFGGVPLPGGAVYLNKTVLTPRWQSIVSAAGPASNLIIFLVLGALLNPAVGLVDFSQDRQPLWAQLLCAMVVLEIFSVIINLLPIPPLDGYGIIEPWLPPEIQQQARSIGWFGVLFVFFVVFRSERVMQPIINFMGDCVEAMGLPVPIVWDYFAAALEW